MGLFTICFAQNTMIQDDNSNQESQIASDENLSEIENQSEENSENTSGTEHRKTKWGIVLIVLIFLIMLIIPFIPAFREMINPKDDKPLLINQEYVRDHRFMDKQLLSDLQKAFDKSKQSQGAAKLKDKTPIDVVNEINPTDTVNSNHVIVVSTNMKAGHGKIFDQIIQVKGKADFGDNCKCNILMVEKDIHTGNNFVIRQWMSSNADITIGKNAILGDRVACDGTLQINQGTKFSNLYAMPIATYDADFNTEVNPSLGVIKPENAEQGMAEVSDYNWYISKKIISIPPYSMVNNSMIIKSDLIFRKGVVVNGNIKVYGKVTLEEEVRIFGELICYGDIEVGENSYIRENLFTQSHIYIKKGARIGLQGHHKSVIGKKGITLEKNVIVFGNIMTAGKGVVV